MNVKCDFCAKHTEKTITVCVEDDCYGGCEAQFEVCPKCGKQYLEGKRGVENAGLHMEVMVPKRAFSVGIRDYLSTL